MEYLLSRGGIIIYPLLISSLVALTIIIERFYQFIRIPRQLPDKLMEVIKENIALKKYKEAASLCEGKGPTARILKRGIINAHKDPEDIEKLMEELKWDEFPRLEKHLEGLNFVGKISPSLGLLGTVTGMIKTFQALSLNGEPQQLAAGISEALITTAVGLIISIPTLAAYYYFINKIKQMINHTEKREIELLNFISEHRIVNDTEIYSVGRERSEVQA
ncbi:MotA/TolQ/ExbB proton channel family protein [Iocasia frigidifontis]|uniref:MotA/TolQ/ExbB proton channel family protein n=1 Tax=Iocasia fonsfrigidae TaxID=2682810 RepID=A0A8A7KC02_9FIRM|nr:MotA/TolQ/ExbB proton channel family protein [Iocasia fonsfrigidae]QTL97615.1 MotA/TolQ/ExbB proton channel family protein [Iocasia fonsfrigidae]